MRGCAIYRETKKGKMSNHNSQHENSCSMSIATARLHGWIMNSIGDPKEIAHELVHAALTQDKMPSNPTQYHAYTGLVLCYLYLCEDWEWTFVSSVGSEAPEGT
jgi:uncharacterized membrane protein